MKDSQPMKWWEVVCVAQLYLIPLQTKGKNDFANAQATRYCNVGYVSGSLHELLSINYAITGNTEEKNEKSDSIKTFSTDMEPTNFINDSEVIFSKHMLQTHEPIQ